MQIAIYGKGGIGKSTIAANVSAALALRGRHVLQVGCDPKHDSTRLLLEGRSIETILDYIRDTAPDRYRIEEIIHTGEFGVDCAEAGGPEPGIGCAGRGILTTFEMLDKLGVRNRGYDAIIYDVLGDVVCGGFAVPIRNEYADRVFVITSGEFMSIYAANNILRGLKNYETDHGRVGGIIFNARGGDYELDRVRRFAQAVQLPIVAVIPRDDTFAASERALSCVMAAYPESPLAGLFDELAETMMAGALHSACPMTDDDLEKCILGAEESALESSALEGGADLLGGADLTSSADLLGGTTPTSSRNAVATRLPVATQTASQPVATADPDDSPTRSLMSKAVVMKEPLHGCAFNGALTATTQLADCVTIAHGPKSCAHIAFQTITSLSRRMLLERGIVLPMQTAPPIVSTDMNESVMIFGGTELLQKSIREIQQRRPCPPVIFVISTCPSGIIGEDIQAVTALSTEQCKVVPIAADGNLTGDHLQGVLMGYQLIAENLIDRDAEVDPNLINIIGEKTIATSTTDNIEFMNDILGRLGLRVNCRFLCESDYRQVHDFMKAPLNILAYADYMGVALRDYLQSSFGAKFMDEPIPVGFAASCDWITRLAEIYDRPEAAQPIIDDYRQRYQREVARLRPTLAGRRLMVITFNHDIDWILSAALDVGMQIGFVGILNYSQDNVFKTELADHIEELNTEMDYSAMARLDDVRRVSPDVLLGNYIPGDGLGVTVSDTIPLTPTGGFMSAIKMAARWADLMRLNLGEGWRRDADLYRQYSA